MPTDWRTQRETLLLALEREKKPEDRAEAADQLCELAHDAPPGAREEFGPVVVRLLAEEEPWPSDRPRVAAVSAFGFGGNNAHVIVEQYAAPAGLGRRQQAGDNAPLAGAAAIPGPRQPLRTYAHAR